MDESYTYHWKYLPTGSTGTHTAPAENIRREFAHMLIGNKVPDIYFAINAWNKAGGETWKYWV